ncbi:hypothetical protein D3C72_2189920 [compost metagenome]
MVVPRLDAAPLNCPTFTASVGARPAATFVILRWVEAEPTDTSPPEFCGMVKPNAV